MRGKPRSQGERRDGRKRAADKAGRDEDESEDEEDIPDEDRFVFEDENTRQLLGDRYDEFKERFERAVNTVDIDALCDLAEDFDDFPWCREKSREV